jgi:peroxiredoxin
VTTDPEPRDFRSSASSPGGSASPTPLLNDAEFRLAEELGLPSFDANGRRYYSRLTFVARNRRVAKVFYPVFPPQDNASDVAAWLRARRP